MTMPDYDAVVVGAGPNGLAAAVEVARAGLSVLLIERSETVGGGARTRELTLAGFKHDVCSAIHPLGLASPFLKELPLDEYGLRFIHPDAPLAHPLDDGSAVIVERSVEDTAVKLGKDQSAYVKLMGPFVSAGDDLIDEITRPLGIPRHPFLMARFALKGARSAQSLAMTAFEEAPARAVFSGIAAHSMLALNVVPTAGYGLILGALAHSVGWPLPQGGSQNISNALRSYFEALGGKVETGREIETFDELPEARAYLFDVTPRQLDRIAGSELSDRYLARLRKWRYGPGVFKIDWALDGPIPWTAADCARAGTVHVAGSMADIVASEAMVKEGRHPERPFVLLAQQSLFDPTRAPEGKHTAWAYCHVPAGSTVDMTDRIEAQVERFAPGFRDLVLARHTFSAAEIEVYNPNFVGGDINGGIQDVRQHVGRPMIKLVPYATSNRRIYICSSSTPPGGGVHGMCGYNAARAALRRSLDAKGPGL
ncbi:MAG: NAD(P)/FAD-dependent oxidoreductase [Actinomycetota bacterium]|nr:NAD(P)/FAD-dependent oxidoreductase [Actinomycetota bacterium]